MSLGGHLVWEIAQLPLYTIFWSGTPARNAYAVLHCTAGDMIIASTALIAPLVALGSARWPGDRVSYSRIAMFAIALGFAYTVFSEWLNTSVQHAWSYTAAMPVVPPLGIGLAPLLQWVVVPTLAFLVAHKCAAQPQAQAA